MTAGYESDDVLARYLLLHYGAPAEITPFGDVLPEAALRFPTRCVTETIAPAELPDAPRALDVGCAVGRSAFELARFCREVVAVDASRRFIAAARTLRETGGLAYRVPVEGELREDRLAAVPAGIDRARVRFHVADAHALPAALGRFDVILAANLLCRLREPQLFLAQLPALLTPGGFVVFTTPATWRRDFTDPAHWLGGYTGAHGGPVHTLAGLRAALAPAFELRRRLDLPLVIREHARKYEFIVAEATTWRRQTA